MTSSRSAIGWAVACVLLWSGALVAQEHNAAGDQPVVDVAHSADHHGEAEGEHHDAGHAHAATVRGEPHGKYGKLPEFLYVDPILALWTFSVFTVLFFLLKYLAWNPIIAALEEREKVIEAAQEQAKQARLEAQALLDQHEKEMGQAHEEARRLLDQARESANRECEELISKARLQAAQAHEKAELDIETAKQAALEQVRASAVELASEIAGKVAGKDLSGGDFSDLIEEVKS